MEDEPFTPPPVPDWEYDFDEYGLRQSRKHLSYLCCEDVMDLPILDLCEYVDHITFNMFDEPEFLERYIYFLDASYIKNHIEDFTPTSLGCLAFVYWFSTDEFASRIAGQALNWIKVIYNYKC